MSSFEHALPNGGSTAIEIPQILGCGLAFVFLVWVLRDFHLIQALREIANVDWKWVVLGMAFDVLSYGAQAVRWQFLLRPLGRSD